MSEELHQWLCYHDAFMMHKNYTSNERLPSARGSRNRQMENLFKTWTFWSLGTNKKAYRNYCWPNSTISKDPSSKTEESIYEPNNHLIKSLTEMSLQEKQCDKIKTEERDLHQ